MPVPSDVGLPRPIPGTNYLELGPERVHRCMGTELGQAEATKTYGNNVS